MSEVKIYDVSLRDGNHAVSHSISLKQISEYAEMADQTGVYAIEVGHGNGIGASSFHLGFSSNKDEEMFDAARKVIKKAKLSTHVIPGYARLSDIDLAISCGVELFRIASHCSESNTTKRYVEYALSKGVEVSGVLMMSHMLDSKQLSQEAKNLASYGCESVIIMDSAGAMLPSEVYDKVRIARQRSGVNIGFHAHNNLGLAVGNAVYALRAGATIIDGSVRGFGAGAGNAAIEIISALLSKLNLTSNVKINDIFTLADTAESILLKNIPVSRTSNIASGLSGVFSGFERHVKFEAEQNNVSPLEIWLELGKQNVIAGQEDMVSEIAFQLKSEKYSA